MKRSRVLFLYVTMLFSIVVLAGCGGGGGGKTGTVAPSAPRLGKVQAKVFFPNRSASQTIPGLEGASDTVLTADSVSVTIGITGVYSVTGAAFDPVVAQTDISLEQGYGRVTVVNVPVGTNHLLTAIAKWPNGEEDVIKCIITSVAENQTTQAMADQESTSVAEAALYYASQYKTTLDKVSSETITLIGDAVDYFNVQGALSEEQLAGIMSYVTGCNDTAIQNVASAKNYLFKSAITKSDVAAAKSAVTTALGSSPNCPDANLLSSIIDLIDEGERVSTQVLTDPESIFPIDSGYNVGDSIGRISKPVFKNLPRVANTLDPDTSNPSEFQTEIANNTLGVLAGALEKLEKVRANLANNTTWTFTYPKDPANPSLGSETLDKNDIDVLTGALKLVVGFVNYALAYNLDPPANYAASDPCPEGSMNWEYSNDTYQVSFATDTSPSALISLNTCYYADTDKNGILTPTEYLPPSPFGTLRSGGSTYLANSKTHISGGLSMISTAVNSILAETQATVGGVSVESTLIADVQHYKHYLSEFAASFGGTATAISFPEVVECWYSSTYGYYSDDIIDPDYNTEDLPSDYSGSCFTITQPFSATMNFGALTAVTNLRNMLPDLVMNQFMLQYCSNPQQGDYYMQSECLYFGHEEYQLNSNFSGNTMGGLFPSGIQKTWFDTKSANFTFWLYFSDATTQQPISETTLSSATLLIDGKTISCQSAWSGDLVCGQNFGSNYYGEPGEKPAAADYVTFNKYFGTQATVNIPGYPAYTFTTYDNWYYGPDVELTSTNPEPEPSVGCSTTADQNVASAKSYLFKSTLTSSDVTGARSAVNSALSDSPNCPDANLLSGIIDLIDETERVSTEVLTDPESIFPIDTGYSIGESIGRVTKPVFKSLPRVANTLDKDTSKPSDFQAEIVANTLNVFEGALSKLESVRESIANDADWGFTYPKDPANPSLGNEILDKNDIDVLTAALKLIVGFLNYSLAYNLDPPALYAEDDPCPEGDFSYTYDGQNYISTFATDTTPMALISLNTCFLADTNSDGVLTPDEYMPPSPFGTLAAGGASYLSNSQAYISGALSLLSAAVDSILAETQATVGGVPLESALIADVLNYKHYLDEIAASFGGAPTSITVPEVMECWYPSTFDSGFYSEKIMDPDYNTDELPLDYANSCFTVSPSFTATMNFGAMADVSDVRNILPDLLLDPFYLTYCQSSVDCMYFGDNYDYSDTFLGNTMGGLFPGGVQKAWFDSKRADFSFYFLFIDSTTQETVVPDPMQPAILSIDGKTFTCGTYYDVFFKCQPQFVDDYGGMTSLPTAGDYITFNNYFGTPAMLSVPGYQDYSFVTYDANFFSYQAELISETAL